MLPFAVFLFAFAGHFGLHLAFYNRINATGLTRWKIKLIERSVAVECFLLPFFFVMGRITFLRATASDWSFTSLSIAISEVPIGWKVYAIVCLTALVCFGIPWLIHRPIFGRSWLAIERTTRHVNLVNALESSPIGSTKCRLNSMLPLNQILTLAIESKTLPVHGLPEELRGLKLAHLSDTHLTGDMLPNFYAYVSQQVMQWQPDIIALTGDIVDKDRCVPWLGDCFGALRAPLGCYFILGNHDTRVADPAIIRNAMHNLGWHDLGGRQKIVDMRGKQVALLGNEMPWFKPAPSEVSGEADFRILLSHSPDQISWAREHSVNLMLAGHTHGGHGRLPFIGPMISPSRYGSRFASGEFYLSPTTMHVTRGIFGTHLQRVNCPPELSLLTLNPSTN